MHRLQRLCPWGRPAFPHQLFGRVPIPSCLSAISTNFPRHNSNESPSEQQNNGRQLLEYWQGLLGNTEQQHAGTSKANSAKSRWTTENIRDLLHAAIRVRQGRVTGVLPEQLVSTFVQVYQSTMNADDRLKLFQLLCQDFGVQGDLTCLPHNQHPVPNR